MGFLGRLSEERVEHCWFLVRQSREDLEGAQVKAEAVREEEGVFLLLRSGGGKLPTRRRAPVLRLRSFRVFPQQGSWIS